MYRVTVRISARKTETVGYFSNFDVATHVASLQTGYDNGEGTMPGEVEEVSVDSSDSIEAWTEAQEASAELAEQEQMAALIERLDAEEQRLLAKYAAQLQAVL